jgi:hypothetical protein
VWNHAWELQFLAIIEFKLYWALRNWKRSRGERRLLLAWVGGVPNEVDGHGSGTISNLSQYEFGNVWFRK